MRVFASCAAGSTSSRLRWKSFSDNGVCSGSRRPRVVSFSTLEPQSRTPKQAEKDYKYCVNIVQNRDRESYLCGLLMPRTARRSYFAVRAFNAELASIKDGSMNRRAGAGPSEEPGSSVALKMRLQWWNEALNCIYHDGYPSREAGNRSYPMRLSTWSNPVVRELGAAVVKRKLTKRFLERLLESRENDLDCNQFRTLNETIDYSENTFSSLLYLSLECAGVSCSRRAKLLNMSAQLFSSLAKVMPADLSTQFRSGS